MRILSPTTLKEQERESLKLITKWGCDGSHQSQFKQKFANDADSDANLFQSSFVPLRLVSGCEGEKLIWENPTPSSSRFCRPIRFRFVKENTDVTEEEINYVKNSWKFCWMFSGISIFSKSLSPLST